MIHRGRHTSLLLLSATTATVIWVISHRAVATKGYNIDISTSPTSLAESGADQYKYLLTLSILRRWLSRIDLTKFFCVRKRYYFLMQLNKREIHPINHISLTKIKKKIMLKNFIQPYISYNTGESALRAHRPYQQRLQLITSHSPKLKKAMLKNFIQPYISYNTGESALRAHRP
jgi:hypothetical protein